MGKLWLHDAVAPLQKALGEKLVLYPGYATRSRSTGGFEDIRGIVMHHDADPPTGSDIDAVSYCVLRAPDKPIANFHLVRNGTVFFHTAGASNHAGKGGPLSTSKGAIPLNQGNIYMIGIEASNNGVGETWPDAQMDSYMLLVAVLCKTFNLKPESDVYGHFDYCAPSCPGRKIDPAGPTPTYNKIGGLTGVKTWKLQEVRTEVGKVLASLTLPEKPDYEVLGATYPTPPAMPKLEYGVVHSNVPWLQAVLSSMHTRYGEPIYNPEWVGADIVNGEHTPRGFGDATKAALIYWETVNSLTGDGVYDTLTANKMLSVRGL